MDNQTTPTQTNTSILDVLAKRGILGAATLAALPPMEDNTAIADYLEAHKLASAVDIMAAFAEIYNLPFVRLNHYRIKPEVLNLIPELVARRYNVVAYDKEDDVVHVAIASPTKMKTGSAGLLHALQKELKLDIAPAFTTLADIKTAHRLYSQYAKVEPAKTVANMEFKQTNVNPSPNVPAISLIGTTIKREILQRFPREIAYKYHAVPFDAPAVGQLAIATTIPHDPTLKELVDFIEEKNGLKVKVYSTDQASLDYALGLYGPVQVSQKNEPNQSETAGSQRTETTTTTREAGPVAKTKQAVPSEVSEANTPEVKPEDIAIITEKLTPLQAELYQGNQPTANPTAPERETIPSENALDSFIGQPIKTVNDLITIIKTANIPKAVAAMIALAIGERASDIHIEAAKEKVRLRYRIDGELSDVLLMPRTVLAPIVSRIKIMAELKIDENRIPQDGRFDVTYQGREIDLRVSTLPTVHGEKVVMRILDKSTGVLNLADLGLEGENFDRLVKASEKPYGIVLSTGPTGSGKSTTLYAILGRIAKPTVNVVTLEDPVEYEIKGINQTQIKPKIGFTFAEGLRSILRQDPNIIMVGEIRDRETAEMATHSALTGHLVLSTLHTNNAAGALPRLINMGVEAFLITSSVNAIIGQRLVRRVCPDCKEEIKLPAGVIEEIKKELDNPNIKAEFKDPASWHFYHGQGCSNCNQGYRGRIGIFEVLVMSDKIEELAVKNEPASAINDAAITEGMVTMKQDGLLKAIAGLTTVEEVMNATIE